MTRYLSIQQVADMWGVEKHTVRAWIARGQLPAKRINARVIRIRLEDAENLGRPARVAG